MKPENYKYIILFISINVLAIVGLQISWNLKNYKENKVQLLNEVENAFKSSNDDYFRKYYNKHKLIPPTVDYSVQLTHILTKVPTATPIAPNAAKTTKNQKAFFCIVQTPDLLDKVSKAIDKEFERKNIVLDYSLEVFEGDSIFDRFQRNKNANLTLSIPPRYLNYPNKLQMSFSDPTLQTLKRSLIGNILSLLLSLSIIFCFLYLLKTINRQKKIDEMKNDLISNITHEFKTPITTVSTALEGIKNFNNANDAEKTDRYLSISGQQLKRLMIMVEKLLETASLETDKITLNKEPVDIAALLEANIEKHQINAAGKQFSFACSSGSVVLNADLFHLENAISNVIDNAVKYGGDAIMISLKKEQQKIIILIEDSGKSIEKNEREKIFDKFYRVQKGNIHDVKGFGIGLYYSKKIIEKHKGSIELLESSKTVFKIAIPDE